MASIRHSPIIAIICSIFINEIKSQLVVCSGGAGTQCVCPPASNPAVQPGEMCVLDCSRPDQCVEMTLTCRAGDPCYINCAGKASCSDKTVINANSATDLTVRCSHEDACKTDIHITCGIGDCALECVRFGSCLEFGWVDTRFSKSWTCNGMFCPWALLPLPYSPSPTPAPTLAPTSSPSPAPTLAPTFSPTMPSISPTNDPTTDPTNDPTRDPTNDPTIDPTSDPTKDPTINPTYNPTKSPSVSPTKNPTTIPTPAPSNDPTVSPTKEPTFNPSNSPTLSPTDPTDTPTTFPTSFPTYDPTPDPTLSPTEPTDAPTKAPIVAQEAEAAAFLNSTGWTALISVLTIIIFCCMLIIIIVIFYKRWRKDQEETKKQMAVIETPDTSQSNISPDTDATRETDMQVVDGLETTGKMASVSELDLNVLHSLRQFNKQDRKRIAATNGGKCGESKDFVIDPNLVSAFMFGGGTDGFDGEAIAQEQGDDDGGNPFRDGFEETGMDDYDNFNGNFVNPFDDDEPNELQQADSMDEMGLLQQRVKLMRLLQQQYELMNDYNMDRGHGHQHAGSADSIDMHNVDMGYL